MLLKVVDGVDARETEPFGLATLVYIAATADRFTDPTPTNIAVSTIQARDNHHHHEGWTFWQGPSLFASLAIKRPSSSIDVTMHVTIKR